MIPFAWSHACLTSDLDMPLKETQLCSYIYLETIMLIDFALNVGCWLFTNSNEKSRGLEHVYSVVQQEKNHSCGDVDIRKSRSLKIFSSMFIRCKLIRREPFNEFFNHCRRLCTRFAHMLFHACVIKTLLRTWMRYLESRPTKSCGQISLLKKWVNTIYLDWVFLQFNFQHDFCL